MKHISHHLTALALLAVSTTTASAMGEGEANLTIDNNYNGIIDISLYDVLGNRILERHLIKSTAKIQERIQTGKSTTSPFRMLPS